MSWAHEREFRGRAALFWGLTFIARLRARSVPGVSNLPLLLGARVAAAIPGIV